jgi:hypothetical protein
MGLDQHAHLRNAKINWAKYYSEEEYSGEPQVFVWRKHARLQQFMAVKYAEQNPQNKDPGSFNLGFNGGPVKLTKEIVDELEKAIDNNYYDYFAADGYFWGQQYQEESVKDYKDQDTEFLQWCKDELSNGNQPEYYCSW